MKNDIRASVSALLLIAVFTLFSCSKDSLPAPAQSGSSNSISQKMAGGGQPVLTGGSEDGCRTFGNLQLIVAPIESKSLVTVFNDSYNSGEISACDNEDGMVYIRKIPTGTYKVTIIPHNPIYSQINLDNVVISDGLLTDLGTISVDY